MRLPKFFGKPKKPNLIVRRIVGDSMSPTLRQGRIVVALCRTHFLQVGDVIVLRHDGLEKIKRIKRIDPRFGVYVVGDNPARSTDSRHFGWVPVADVLGRLIWPRATSNR